MTEKDLEKVFVDSRNRAVRARKKIEDKYQWKRCRDAYFGAQNVALKKDQPEWKAALVSPKMFEIVERLEPVLTDSRPKPQVGGEGQEDTEVAALITRALDREFEAQNVDTTSGPVLRDMLIFGTGFFRTGVNPGYGKDEDLYTCRVPPWTVYASERATSDKKPTSVWIHNRMTEAEIWCTYPPEIAKEILKAVPRGKTFLRLDEETYFNGPSYQEIDGPVTMESGTSSQLAAGTGSFETHVKNGPGSLGIDSDAMWDFWEGYLEDPQTKNVPMPDPEFDPQTVPPEMMGEGFEPPTINVPVPVYPHGRFVCLVGDTYIKALDRPNPYPHKDCPLIPVRCYDLGDYFAMGFLMRLLDTDEAINKIQNQLLNCVALTLNPVIVADNDSDINFEAFAPYPGVVVTKRWDRIIEFRPPPPLPNYVFQLLQDLERLLNDASGISDISRGNYSGGLDDVSGVAVNALKEPTYTRIRAILRNYEKALTRWMKQTAANMLVYRDEQYFRRTLGPFMVAQMVPDPMTGMMVEQMVEAPYPWESWTEDDLAMLPDIKMSVGSSLPTDKNAKVNTAINFYDRGALGGPAGSPVAVDQLLKAADWPEREKIVRAAEQAFAQAQMMQQQQMEQEASGGAPPGLNKATGQGASPEEQRAQEQGNQNPADMLALVE